MYSVEEQWLEAVDPEVLRRRRERVALVAGAILVFVLAGILAYILFKPGPPADVDVLAAAELGVKGNIDAAGHLQFNAARDAQIVRIAPNLYEVRGWVADLAPSGIVKRYLYTCVVERNETLQTDTVREINIIPQY